MQFERVLWKGDHFIFYHDLHGSGSTGPVFESVTKNDFTEPLLHLLMNGPAESPSGRIFLYTARQQSVHMKIVASLTDP